MAELRVKIVGGIVAATLMVASLACAGTGDATTRPVMAAVVIPASPAVKAAASALSSINTLNSAARFWMPKGFHAIRDIAYVPHGGHSQTLDLYIPDVLAKAQPVMVWIHGGGWFSGDKSAPPGMGLLQRGFVVASINYRLSTEAVFPAQIFDCKAAIRFLRANAKQYGIDSARIGVWGDSAGGQLATLLGTTNGRADYEGTEGILRVSSDVQAVCDWFGPSDFSQAGDVTPQSAAALKQLFGGVGTGVVSMARFASPALQISARQVLPPFLIMHGDEDRLVPEHQSRLLYQKLKSAGATAQLVILAHGGHGYGWFRSRDDLTMVYDFFDRCFRRTSLRAAIPATRPTN
jgi:acetyl esterase/lipase